MTEQAPVPQVGTDEIVGARAHMLMWRTGKSQAAVSAALNMAKSQLSRKLRGGRPWYAHEIAALARVLGTSVAYLYGETDDPSAPPPGLEPGTVRLDVIAGQGHHEAKILRFVGRVRDPEWPRPGRRPRTVNHPVLLRRFAS
jgi:transcriptional regulator with XRE-family HTH domain